MNRGETERLVDEAKDHVRQAVRKLGTVLAEGGDRLYDQPYAEVIMDTFSDLKQIEKRL